MRDIPGLIENVIFKKSDSGGINTNSLANTMMRENPKKQIFNHK